MLLHKTPAAAYAVYRRFAFSANSPFARQDNPARWSNVYKQISYGTYAAEKSEEITYAYF